MNIDKILILGSTYLTELVVDELKSNNFNLIGYVPNSIRSTVPGNVSLEKTTINCDYDLAISIQYDSLIKSNPKTFNLHTGLLPEFGGLDILRHTLNEGKREQGLTFHRMTDEYDHGPIVSKITYPVLPEDTETSLYIKQCSIAPSFVVSCLKLISGMTVENVSKCIMESPRILERKYKIDPIDVKELHNESH